jgi:hypothetical protein
MTYQVAEIVPTYQSFTDAQNGFRVFSVSEPYATKELAITAQAEMRRKDYENMGEGIFVVFPTGGSPFTDRVFDDSIFGDECPW